LRNFQGFAIIMTALTHTYISQDVNKFLQEEDRELFSLKHDLEALFDKKNGYRSLKRTINQANFPMVPFMPIIVQDILRIDGYHQSVLKLTEEDEARVNLDKMEMLFETFENVHLSKFSFYEFEAIKVFQDFLGRYFEEVLYAFTKTRDTYEIEEILYKMIKPQEKSTS